MAVCTKMRKIPSGNGHLPVIAIFVTAASQFDLLTARQLKRDSVNASRTKFVPRLKFGL